MELVEIRKKLKKVQDKDRYEHTKGVMYTAGCLAMAYGYDMQKAMLAGLLHDCAKCIPNDEKVKRTTFLFHPWNVKILFCSMQNSEHCLPKQNMM